MHVLRMCRTNKTLSKSFLERKAKSVKRLSSHLGNLERHMHEHTVDNLHAVMSVLRPSCRQDTWNSISLYTVEKIGLGYL